MNINARFPVIDIIFFFHPNVFLLVRCLLIFVKKNVDNIHLWAISEVGGPIPRFVVAWFS